MQKTPQFKKSLLDWKMMQYMIMRNYTPMSHIKECEIDISESVERISQYLVNKVRCIFNTMNSIVVVMRIYDNMQKIEANYGMTLCQMNQKNELSTIYYRNTEKLGSDALITFYSYGPSYISSDGEYRSKFTSYLSLNASREKNMEIFNRLEEYVSYICTRRGWIITPVYFYPKLEEEKKNTEVEYSIRQNRLPFLILVATWFNEMYNSYFGITEFHINEAYRNIFYKNIEADHKKFKEFIEEFGIEEIEKIRISISHTYSRYAVNDHDKELHFVTNGIKMIPLNIKEVQDPIKLKYRPWREYLILQRAGSLVLNGIAAGFPLCGDWMYIKNSRKGLFDNQSQYKRMQHSELAKNIVHILYEAQRNTYFSKRTIEEYKEAENYAKEWFSGKFKKLNEKIEDPINYCIEDIIMSEVALAFPIENMGRTLADSIKLHNVNDTYAAKIGYPYTKDPVYFARYMFEICYNLYCLNTKLGTIHSDLHLNNIMIGELIHVRKLDNVKDPAILFVVDNEHQYLMPYSGYNTSIIDFSRSIIHYDKFEVFQDHSLPKKYNIVSDSEKFRAIEVQMLINLYIQMFPNKEKQREELVVLFKKYFEAAFKLLTAVDTYMFSIRLIRIFTQYKKINKKCIELVTKINKLAEQFITVGMNNLLEDPEHYSQRILDQDYPNCIILEKCFSEFNNGQMYKKKTPTIVDLYVYDTELKYHSEKYELFPPVMKKQGFLTKKGEDYVPGSEEYIKGIRNAHEASRLANLDMMMYIARRHAEKLF
jgi:hypothetical protein